MHVKYLAVFRNISIISVFFYLVISLADSTSGSSYPESPEVILPDGSHSHYQIQHQILPPQQTHYHHEPPSPVPNLMETRGRYYGEDDEREGQDVPPLPLNTMDSILSVAISAEFNAFGGLGNMQGGGRNSHNHHSYNGNSKELNKAEKAKLSELFYASEALNAPVDQDGPVKVVGYRLMFNVLKSMSKPVC